ncbi:MAG TPA: hypothetical protein VFL80_06770 [Thermoanaerobaculia bacterium]|nr:hypothetical protein [Thermoanaerobaculia bacterium]
MGRWRIEVVTEGGFFGRGLGGITVTPKTIESIGLGTARRFALDAATRVRVEGAIAAALATEWPESNDDGFGDEIRYTLTLDAEGEVRRLSWSGETPRLPSAIADLVDLVLSLRG